jgi:opacity protein-like surface antigen
MINIHTKGHRVNHSRLITLALLAVISTNSHASNSLSTYLHTHLVSAISLGPTWSNGNQSQTLNLGSNTVKLYTVNRATHTMLYGELFVGVHEALPYHMDGQLGLALNASGYSILTGNIWDDASPVFNNYDYYYQLRHRHVALQGKLLFDRGYPLIPWVSAGVGVGFNTAYSYTNVPTITEAVVMPNFTSNTTTTFTYTVGVGVQRQINQHWQIGAGYQFADWGRSQLGRSAGQTTADAPALSHYYTHGILVNVTFLA